MLEKAKTRIKTQPTISWQQTHSHLDHLDQTHLDHLDPTHRHLMRCWIPRRFPSSIRISASQPFLAAFPLKAKTHRSSLMVSERDLKGQQAKVIKKKKSWERQRLNVGQEEQARVERMLKIWIVVSGR